MKLSYIDWYLVEIERNLSDLVPLEKQNSLLNESNNHLSSLAEEFESQGMEEKASQLAAIDRFGTPEKIANQFIENFGNQKRRKPYTLLNILLFASICIVVFWLTVSPGDLIRNGIAMVVIPFAAIFGFYSVLHGKRASARWILLPTIMSLVIGIPAAFYFTVYNSGDSNNQHLVSYNSLRQQVLKLRSERQAINRFTEPYLKNYQALLNDPKYKDGLKRGETLSVPGYRSSGSKGINIVFLPPQKSTMYVAKDPNRVSLTGSEFSFGTVKERKADILTGAMSGEEFRQTLLENLESAKRLDGWHESALGQLETGLNMPVLNRIKLLVFWVSLATLVLGVPASWISSWIGFAIRNWFRFRTRKTGLA